MVLRGNNTIRVQCLQARGSPLFSTVRGASPVQSPLRTSGFAAVRERRLELPRRLTHAPQTCLSTCSSTLAYGRCFGSIESRLHHIGPPHLRQKSLYQSFRFCQGLFLKSELRSKFSKSNSLRHKKNAEFLIPNSAFRILLTPAQNKWPRPRTGGCRAGSRHPWRPSAPRAGPAPRSCRPSPPGSHRRCARWRAGGR